MAQADRQDPANHDAGFLFTTLAMDSIRLTMTRFGADNRPERWNNSSIRNQPDDPGA